MARQKHFAERSERAIRRWQAEGLADPKIDPALAADVLGAMVARFAEIWLVQGYREYDFEEAVEQLTRIWANVLQLEEAASDKSTDRHPTCVNKRCIDPLLTQVRCERVGLSAAAALQHPAEVLLEGGLVERRGLARERAFEQVVDRRPAPPG